MELHSIMPAPVRAAWSGAQAPLPIMAVPVLHLLPVRALQDDRLCAVSASLPGSASGGGAAAMLREACSELRYWHQSRGAVTTLLAPLRLRCGPALVGLVEEALEDCRIAPSLLDLALHSAVLCDGEPGVEAMLAASALRDLGAGLVLDAIGRPDAGCALLRRLPFSALRLHACVAAELPHDKALRDALAGMVRVAHGQAATVIASGIGTALQCQIVAELGCDQAQGPLFGPSVEAALFRRRLGPVRQAHS